MMPAVVTASERIPEVSPLVTGASCTAAGLEVV
jgi:hypothetical protein